MTPTHANKKGTRYRYYVSHSLVRGDKAKSAQGGQRVPAGEMEALVEDRLLTFLCDGAEICAVAEQSGIQPRAIPTLIKKAAALAESWGSMQPAARRPLLHRLVKRIDVRRDVIDVTVRPAAIAGVVSPAPSAGGLGLDHAAEEDGPVAVLNIPSRLRRVGKENRMLMKPLRPVRAPLRTAASCASSRRRTCSRK